MFSSGTTGAPKCIQHGAGGTLLEHVKEHRLHCDLGPGDKLFFQTSCGWMMWNWQLSALASGVELVLYDGPLEGRTPSGGSSPRSA
jgi:acetoacetyl-CoA synthetase